MDHQEPEQGAVELGAVTSHTRSPFPGLCDIAIGIPTPGLTDD